MGKSFFISNELFEDKDRGITTSGWSLTFLPVVILEFIPKEIRKMIVFSKIKDWEKYDDGICRLYYFQTTGNIPGDISRFTSAQFNVIYQALELGYDYLESLSEEEREKWIDSRRFSGSNWGRDNWENHEGDFKRVSIEFLQLMRDDPRYDAEFKLEDHSIEEIENMPDDPNVKIEDYDVDQEELRKVIGRSYEEAVEVVRK